MDLEMGMPSYPDKFFDLAIVDPPYGGGGSISIFALGLAIRFIGTINLIANISMKFLGFQKAK